MTKIPERSLQDKIKKFTISKIPEIHDTIRNDLNRNYYILSSITYFLPLFILIFFSLISFHKKF